MDSIIICITLLLLTLGGYVLWPSRYNIIQHLGVGGSFVSIVVPSLILSVQEKYPKPIVDMYINILCLGAGLYMLGAIVGFILAKNVKTNLSFEIMDVVSYEQRTIKITKFLMLIGVIGLIVSYIGMGFIPMFAEDPISAKLFRGAYQQPYLRVASLYRASFYILASIMPIACILWYKFRFNFLLLLIISALILMAISLTRSGAFMGVVLAFAIVMSFKSRTHFMILMVMLVGVFVFSSFFYYIVGVRTYTGEKSVWEIITAGTPDIPDHLDFLSFFNENPAWTYGRTMYGGLIPGHYKWNPAVYTLIMVNPGKEINEIGSGGLRLPLPVWGYVSFKWIGVIILSLLTGFLNGVYLRLVKDMFKRHESIVVRTVIIIAFGTVFGLLVNFAQLSIYTIPPAIVSLFYLYRFQWSTTSKQ